MIANLLPTEDQRMIADGVDDFLSGTLPIERLREVEKARGAAERAVWAELTELGLFGLGLAEAKGGLGLGIAEETLAAKLLGHHLISPSVLAQIIAPHIIEDTALRSALLNGETRTALGTLLNAETAHLFDADGAELILLFSEDGSCVIEERGNLEIDAQIPVIDETLSVNPARLTGTPIAKIDEVHHASILIAAYLTGMSKRVTEFAVEYAKTREQFGQPIGAFQAIKHACADMAVRTAAADAQTKFAAVAFGYGTGTAMDVGAARILAGRAAIQNAHANIQVHGGMGFTAECDAHLFLKRAQMLQRLGLGRAAARAHILEQI